MVIVRLIVMLLGLLAVVAGLALLVGGGVVAGIAIWGPDEAGFFSVQGSVAGRGHAVVSEGFEVDPDIPWARVDVDAYVGEVRVVAEHPQGQPLFLGIGPVQEVRSYLQGVEYQEVVGIESNPFRASYQTHPGTLGSPPPPPEDQAFWTASTSGTGAQELRWRPESGQWILVLMNADGSEGVEAAVTLGVRVPFAVWVGVGLIGVGVILLVVGGLLIYVSVERMGQARRAGATVR